MRTSFRALGLVLLAASIAFAQENAPLTLDSVPEAQPIAADEPLHESFSAEQAARYLDVASLNWQKSRNCATCHTNMAYLMARPALSEALPDSGEVRSFFEDHYRVRWDQGRKPPAVGYQPVVVGAALAWNDAMTSGRLAEATRGTLDLMWATQRADGGWDWAKCGWAPMEIDDHYGVTLAALAVGVAPGQYAETEAAQAGIDKVRQFLRDNPAPSLHHRLMVAWASLRVDGLMAGAERTALLEQALAKQLPDGGWATPGLLADWKEFQRKDDQPHAVDRSDAYGTGLVLVLAREMGVAADDPRLTKGVAWLKAHQGESGKWFTPSPTKDSRNYFTNFGTAFAVLGLQACGQLPGWKLNGPRP